MPESFSLNEIFKKGMTRENFLDRVKQLQNENNSDELSIFIENLDVESAENIFNLVASQNIEDNDNGDVISETDIQAIAGYDDDKTTISVQDIILAYQEMLKKTVVNGIEGSDSDVQSITSSEYMDALSNLRQMYITDANSRKLLVQTEISKLVNDNTISDDLKKKLQNNKTEEKKVSNDIENARHREEQLKRNLRIARSEIQKRELILKDTKESDLDEILQSNDDRSRISDELESWKQSEAEYSAQLTECQKGLSVLDSELQTIKDNNATILGKIKNQNAKIAQEIEAKENEIKDIDTKLAADLAALDENEKTMQQSYQVSIQQSAQSYVHYSNVAGGYTSDKNVSPNAANALARAAGEIGVRELSGHNDGSAVARYRNGVDNGAAWCASFVSWCYKGNNVFGYQASVAGIRDRAGDKYKTKGSYIPKAGDVMIQKSNGASHTGIVERVDTDGTIHTIEGNASNQVKRVTYRVGSKGYNQISGFVDMSSNNNKKS